MIFDLQGSGPNALWLVDGNPDFSVLPPGTVKGFGYDQPIPIRLHLGTPAWGAIHIGHKHAAWINGQKHFSTAGQGAPQLVWNKLAHTGPIYITEHPEKLKISLRLAPASLLVMQLRVSNFGQYFSVTTLYQHPPRLDGSIVGRYHGRK